MTATSRLTEALRPRYEILRELGTGGMATVYLARHRESAREVAVKVLDSDLSSALGLARFEREIRITETLAHPKILRPLESGEAAGLLYYIMPYVPGESLRQRLDRAGPLSVPEALAILDQVADALDYAHGQGVVHRDIKPENILLAGDQAVVADFGIARLLVGDGSDRLTATGHSVGTAAYVSPEQAGGDTRVDARSDVYSLACVLFEMLSGEPPFGGANPRSIVARHMSQPAPTLDVVRPELSDSVVAAVARALAKVPADRFESAGEFAQALRAPRPVRTAEQRRARWRRAATVAAALAIATSALLWLLPPGLDLDPRKVVVFPLATTSAITDPSAGWDVALAVEAALEHTEPLKFIDGWTWLDEAQRADPTSVTASTAQAVARSLGAAYYVAGAARAAGAVTQVVLRLHDVAADTLVVGETAEGPPDSATLPNLALEALLGLLPHMVDPDRPVDLSPLTDRTPAATTLFLQGERAYRQSHFDDALDLYRRAVNEDSLHAFAAIKGAQAASWASDFGQAEALIALALENADALPTKYRSFAAGLDAYVTGDAETGVASFREAVQQDDEWPEALTALGEVYYHLLPSDAVRPDSIAHHWFATAWSLDSTFAPPLFHLTEIALRRGDVSLSQELIRRWREFHPDTFFLRQVEHSVDCLADGPESFDWAAHVGTTGRSVLQAAMSLAGGASQLSCAEPAFRAVVAADLPRSVRWTAYKGLFGAAMARGRHDRVDSLFEARTPDMSAATTLFLYGALAGGPFRDQATETEARLRRLTGDLYRSDRGVQPARWRWLMGAWLARLGQLERAQALAADMEAHAEEVGDREERLLARALRAHTLAEGEDKALAIARLRELTPTGTRDRLAFRESEALAPERLLLAELLLSNGQPQEAYDVAALLDHPIPQIYLAFVPRSLALRLEAAEMMGRQDLVEEAVSRLTTLGWTDPQQYPPATH